MATSASNYKILLEALIDPSRINIQVNELQQKYNFVINLDTNNAEAKTKLLARNMDEVAEAANRAEVFLARAKSYPDNPSVNAARASASELVEIGARSLGGVTDADLARVRELTAQLPLQKANLDKAKGAWQSWGDGIKNALTQTLQYSISLGLVYGALAKLKEGLQYVVDLNKEMVNIQVLQIEGAKTSDEINTLADGYNNLAKEMGVTTLEVARGSVEFLRQGKTIAQTGGLLKSSLMLSKLGALESAQATEYLTAIMNGFQMEVEDTAVVVDKLINLDNNAATSAGEISTALSYSAAVANQAGISFDELAAMVTVMSNTTRMSGEVIGQALKTIITRMEAVAANKTIDDFGENLNGVEKTLRSVGIEIRDSTDSFKPMGAVIDEVGSKWETYNEVQKAQIAGAIAGKLLMPEHAEMYGLTLC